MTDLLLRATDALRHAGPDAVITNHTALALYGCHAADRVTVHVLVPDRRRIRSRAGIVMHHGAIHRHDVETLYGLKVLAPERALAEVLCRDQPVRALACFHDAMEMHPPDHRGRFLEWVGRCIRARADPRGQTRALEMLRGCYRLIG